MTIVIEGPPNFRLAEPNPNTKQITDATWWLWLQLRKLEPKSKLSGILAKKKGYHGTGEYNEVNHPKDYSIREAVDRTGPWWKKYASALDWTFPDAQAGDFRTIDKYTSLLMKAATDPADPRLDMVLREFYGNIGQDRVVDGYDERHEKKVSSDSSHLWHLHFSFTRSQVGDFWGMWALLTVLMGWTVAQWRASLPGDVIAPAPVKPTLPLPKAVKMAAHKPGSRTLRHWIPNMKGEDVAWAQRWIGSKWCGKADGIFGRKTKAGVKRYQKMRGIKADGIIGPVTWRHMGVR